MLSVIVITCLIFQTAMALYLLHASLAVDDFEKNLQKFLVILLVHLSTKYFLLAVLHNNFLYGKLASGFSLFYGPFLLIMTRSYVNKPFPNRIKKNHLLPFFVFSLAYIILVIGNSLKIINNNFVNHYAEYYEWLIAASLIIYPILIKRLLRQRDSQFRPDKAKERLISNIATVLSMVILLVSSCAALKLLAWPRTNFDLRTIAYTCFIFIPVLILRYKLQINTHKVTVGQEQNGVGLKKEEVAAGQEALADKRYQKSGMDNVLMDTYAVILVKTIEKGKIYLNAELSLEDLACQTNIPKHHITQLLNDKLKKNFYAFVNEYRIREAVVALEDVSKEVNILSLAYDCGFNSKSSFNNYFKKITSYTPSAYRKMVFAKHVTAV